jgi:arsenate reductase
MAEGFARALHADQVRAWSAGTSPKGLDGLAVRAMGEVGVDISGHRSRTVEEALAEAGGFDLVVTVCGDANESCPAFRGQTRVVHAGFDDPPRLALDAPDDEAAMVHYRRVRDEIRALVETLPGALEQINIEGSRR